MQEVSSCKYSSLQCKLAIIHILIFIPLENLANILMIGLDSDFSARNSAGLSFVQVGKNLSSNVRDWKFGFYISRYLKADNMRCSTCLSSVSMKTGKASSLDCDWAMHWNIIQILTYCLLLCQTLWEENCVGSPCYCSQCHVKQNSCEKCLVLLYSFSFS